MCICLLLVVLEVKKVLVNIRVKDEKNPDPPTLEVSQVSVDTVNQPADPQSAKMIWLVEMGRLGLEMNT